MAHLDRQPESSRGFCILFLVNIAPKMRKMSAMFNKMSEWSVVAYLRCTSSAFSAKKRTDFPQLVLCYNENISMETGMHHPAEHHKVNKRLRG